MLPSRGLSRLRPTFGQFPQGLQRVQHSSRPAVARQFGTAFPKAPVALKSQGVRDALNTRRFGGSLAAAGYISLHQLRLPYQQHARYASTQPVPSPSAAPAEPSSIDLSSTPIDLTTHDMLNIPEQIGYLKALGLDYGVGPTAMMQSLLEHIYIYTGMPWWASIMTVGVLLRLALFKPSIKAAEQSFKIQALRQNPNYEVIRKQSTDFSGKNPVAITRARQQLKLYHQAAGVQTWRTFVPMLQLPLMFGFFRLFRGMAELPVPSLETGGALWFTDLAAADPFYIMPVASSAVLFFVMKSSLVHMPKETATVMKLVMYIMTPLTLLFTFKFAAGLQLFLLTTGILQGLQSWLLIQPWFRTKVGLEPLTHIDSPKTSSAAMAWPSPRTVATTATPVKTGVVDEVKDSAKKARAMVSEKLREYQTNSTGKQAIAKAREYEERRALEEKERYYARMEEKRLKALEQKQKGK